MQDHQQPQVDGAQPGERQGQDDRRLWPIGTSEERPETLDHRPGKRLIVEVRLREDRAV
jgi:hypothetical protein